jgi:2-polyprenyl-6-hydroxyphenyl methylase / 3-demethylubiquinone-9 3-methyltransferase
MKENITTASNTVDADEIAHFTAMADEWWDAGGKFRPLHQMNPLRLGFIRDHIVTAFERDGTASRPLSGLSLLDIGSGGGLLCEPLSRMGASVTGVDAAEKNIHIARLHAAQMGLAIDYRHSTAEALMASGEQYDVVLALEIVEHVSDVDAFLTAVSALVKPGGLLFMSTLNRTAKSYAMAIIGAEYVLRWLPKGTHHWKKFLRPSELILPLERHNIRTTDLQGMVYDPFSARWSLHPRKLDVNYILVGEKVL